MRILICLELRFEIDSTPRSLLPAVYSGSGGRWGKAGFCCRKREIERRREEPPINLTESGRARSSRTQEFLSISSKIGAASRGVSQEQGPLTRFPGHVVLTFSHAIKLSALARRPEMNRSNSDEDRRDRSRINNLNNNSAKGIFDVEQHAYVI